MITEGNPLIQLIISMKHMMNIYVFFLQAPLQKYISLLCYTTLIKRQEAIPMSDLFTEGFDNLMKGLSTIIPKDDPAVKFLTARKTLTDLKKQCEALYAEIGKMALAKDGDEAYGQTAETLRGVLDKIEETQAFLDTVKGNNRKEGESFKDMCSQEEDQGEACPQCGQENPAGAKFCTACGAKVGPVDCPACGHTNAPGTKFCGQCGEKLS